MRILSFPSLFFEVSYWMFPGTQPIKRNAAAAHSAGGPRGEVLRPSSRPGGENYETERDEWAVCQLPDMFLGGLGGVRRSLRMSFIRSTCILNHLHILGKERGSAVLGAPIPGVVTSQVLAQQVQHPTAEYVLLGFLLCG